MEEPYYTKIEINHSIFKLAIIDINGSRDEYDVGFNI